MKDRHIQFVSYTPEELKQDLLKLIQKEMTTVLKEVNKTDSKIDDELIVRAPSGEKTWTVLDIQYEK